MSDTHTDTHTHTRVYNTYTHAQISKPFRFLEKLLNSYKVINLTFFTGNMKYKLMAASKIHVIPQCKILLFV